MLAAEALAQVAAAEHPYPAERFSGRGIVICAGGARLLTCAWVAINVLRRVLGCSLPIQLWHIGPRELGEFEAGMFRPLGVEVLDALQFTPTWPARTLGGWELKAYALVHSRFEQVLLLDADNVAVVDPAPLFEAPQLAEIGAIAWPDRERLSEDNPIWELCRVPFRSEPAWETGQLLVDKSRCWRALRIALHMNMHSETFYPHTHGDKDTFHLAWILAGTRWAMPDYPARLTITGPYQRDFAGRLVFQHRNQAKWRLSGDNQLGPDFRHEAECLRFLSELRDRWSGRIDAVPPSSIQDRETEDALAETRWFHLDEPGAGRRLVELLASNRVGIGAARDCLLRWYVRDGVLTLDGRVRALPPLSPQSGAYGSFAASPGGPPIELHPAPEAGRDALGATAAAVLERLARDRTITEDDAVTTLFTLGQVGDLSDALQRARSRWSDSDEARRAIERAAQRLGGGYPSEDFRTRPGYESL